MTILTLDMLKLEIVSAVGRVGEFLSQHVARGDISPREALVLMKQWPLTDDVRRAIARVERLIHCCENGEPLHRLVIFDADGTLRRCTVPDRPCPHAPDEWEPLADIVAGMRVCLNEHAPEQMYYAVASNQGGVAKGLVSEAMAKNLLRDLYVDTFGWEPWDGAIAMCPHHPSVDGPCGCRKPAPGMLVQSMARRCVCPEETLFVGDLPTDKQAADAAGCDFRFAWDYFGLTKEAWFAQLGEAAS